MSARARGWGPGWPTNRFADQKPLRWITGRVHKDIHELMDLLCAETERRGYSIRRDWSWGYANRPIGNSRTPSNHSWGLAIDINAPTNPQRRPLTTDMPSWMPRLWKSYGFRWGGDYQNSAPDAMHYEFMGTPTDARVQTERARRAFAETTTTTTQEDWDVLKRGDTGPQVGYFQRRLIECGQTRGTRLLPRFGADRDFGAETESAVKSVQGYVGFEQTGVIDMATAIYIQALAHSRQHEGGTGGMTQAQADGRYVRKGSTVTLS